jgi:uncharacterized protein YlzI (FlbEa/FlbD family)
MAFITLPDINNSPVMVNTDMIACITIEPDGIITLHMSSEFDIQTSIPRQILINMLTKITKQPILVQPTTEWAG